MISKSAILLALQKESSEVKKEISTAFTIGLHHGIKRASKVIMDLPDLEIPQSVIIKAAIRRRYAK